ncbi:MAG: hypothetical protein Kow0098_12060 [Ignavibacteriaceae bacterium]
MKFNYEKTIPWLTGLSVFIIYLFTLAPTVVQIDAGELAAIQTIAGIAHPTGYPLYTLAGFLFQLIPLPFSKIYQLNLLAALYCSLGVVFFIKAFLVFINNGSRFNIQSDRKKKIKKKKKKQEASDSDTTTIQFFPDKSTVFTGIIAGALLIAFSKTYWFQSTSVEVYSLHIFLISLIIYFLFKAYTNDLQNVKEEKRGWLIFSVVLASGFSNHMTTLLILPAVAYLYFRKKGFNSAGLKFLLRMILIFAVVLIIFYLYLPLRAAQNPPINWGNPVDWEKFYRHITGKQYQVWIFSSVDVSKKQLAYFLGNLYTEFWLGLIPVLAGIIYLFRKFRVLFVFLIITFFSTLFYSINYDISDIDAYFLLAYISLGFFASAGFINISEWLTNRFRIKLSVTLTAAALVIIPALINFSKTDQSSKYLYEDYTKSLINSVSKDAVIFSYQWDYFLSASYYFQFVENFRTDVKIIDKELLRRSWYYNQLETNYPDVMDEVKPLTEQFKTALLPFERDENYNGNLLEQLYRKLMTELIRTNTDERDFYIGPELIDKELRTGELVLPEGYTLVPDLFLFKVVKTEEYIPAAAPDFKIRTPQEFNYYDNNIRSFIGSMLSRRALYEIQFGKKERALLYINKMKNMFPEYPVPPGLQEILQGS